ncbi:MAG: AraC family transcriptional regulator [Polyangiaceae bacterium]
MGRSASATPSTDAERRFTVAGSAVLALVAYARSRGVDVDPPLKAQGVDLAGLRDPDARVAQGAYNALFASFAAVDEDFGLHMAEHVDAEGFGIVGHLAQRSSTFGDALDRIVRYSRLVHDAGRVEVERTDRELIVYPGCRGLLHEYPRQIAEHAAGSVVVLAGAMLRRPLPITRVTFRHPAPPELTEHQRVFGVLPSFGAEETTVVTRADTSDWPIPHSEPNLVGWLERYADDLLARLRQRDDVVARVDEAIARRLEDGAPAVGEVARMLTLSPRTLQRRLAEQDTNFNDRIDAVRRSLAQRYLRDSQLSVQEVTYLLGFSESKNFHRAFRRWFSTTPRAWRQSPPSS